MRVSRLNPLFLLQKAPRMPHLAGPDGEEMLHIGQQIYTTVTSVRLPRCLQRQEENQNERQRGVMSHLWMFELSAKELNNNTSPPQ